MKYNRTIALALVLSLLCGTVFAVGTPQIGVGSASGAAGQTVSVDVAVQNNPGFVSMRLEVEYDDTYLTLTGVTDAGIFGVKNHKGNVLSWENDTAEEDITANGTIATLTFAVAEGAPAGNYPITVSYDNVEREDILNYDLETVEFAVSGGAITVADAADVGVSTVDGAQIRTVGAQGLRFTSSIDKTAADFDRVVEFGTVLIPSADISDLSELVIGATLNGHAVAKVEAKNLYEVTEEEIKFTAVITEIAEKNYAREYTARAYAILDDGSVVYADAGASRSIYAVASAALADAGVSDADRAVFQAIVDTVENA